jgi:hypothetical protein
MIRPKCLASVLLGRGVSPHMKTFWYVLIYRLIVRMQNHQGLTPV